MKTELKIGCIVGAICALVGGALAFDAYGDVVAYDYAEGESSPALVDAHSVAAAKAMLGEAQGAAMLHALKLQMQKYDADMKTRAGRQAWHGRLVREEIYTNELVKVEVYSNETSGTVWRYRTTFKPSGLKATGRRVTFSTDGVPARLAAARARRAAEVDAGVVVTNVVVDANGGANGGAKPEED